jgi:hypothetical protein
VALLDGFYVVMKDGKFYKSHDTLVDNIDDAYAFILPHAAMGLAVRIGGVMVRK